MTLEGEFRTLEGEFRADARDIGRILIALSGTENFDEPWSRCSGWQCKFKASQEDGLCDACRTFVEIRDARGEDAAQRCVNSSQVFCRFIHVGIRELR